MADEAFPTGQAAYPEQQAAFDQRSKPSDPSPAADPALTAPKRRRSGEVIIGAPKDFDEYDTRQRLRDRGPGYGETIDILRDHK